jgi:hypothetical protein
MAAGLSAKAAFVSTVQGESGKVFFRTGEIHVPFGSCNPRPPPIEKSGKCVGEAR